MPTGESKARGASASVSGETGNLQLLIHKGLGEESERLFSVPICSGSQRLGQGDPVPALPLPHAVGDPMASISTGTMTVTPNKLLSPSLPAGALLSFP